MLKAEIIRFEAQDIITASGVAEPGVTVLPACKDGGHTLSLTNTNGTWEMKCSECGYSGSTSGGTIIGGPSN